MSEKNADLVFNPFFIWLIIIAFLSLEKLLENKMKSLTKSHQSKFIEFTSDRKKVSIEIDSITYIESCDDEVWIRTNTDTSYRTKMNISNWQMALDSRFIRIHRSYLVNRAHISKITPTKLFIGNKALEISRKYRDKSPRK
jgi:DNA-binding LytR/AlgR family response regulator